MCHLKPSRETCTPNSHTRGSHCPPHPVSQELQDGGNAVANVTALIPRGGAYTLCFSSGGYINALPSLIVADGPGPDPVPVPAEPVAQTPYLLQLTGYSLAPEDRVTVGTQTDLRGQTCPSDPTAYDVRAAREELTAQYAQAGEATYTWPVTSYVAGDNHVCFLRAASGTWTSLGNVTVRARPAPSPSPSPIADPVDRFFAGVAQWFDQNRATGVLLVALAALLLVACCCLCIALVVWRRRRRQRPSSVQDAPAAKAAATGSTSSDMLPILPLGTPQKPQPPRVTNTGSSSSDASLGATEAQGPGITMSPVVPITTRGQREPALGLGESPSRHYGPGMALGEPPLVPLIDAFEQTVDQDDAGHMARPAPGAAVSRAPPAGGRKSHWIEHNLSTARPPYRPAPGPGRAPLAPPGNPLAQLNELHRPVPAGRPMWHRPAEPLSPYTGSSRPGFVTQSEAGLFRSSVRSQSIGPVSLPATLRSSRRCAVRLPRGRRVRGGPADHLGWRWGGLARGKRLPRGPPEGESLCGLWMLPPHPHPPWTPGGIGQGGRRAVRGRWHHRLRRERVEGKGCGWRSANRRRRLQTRTIHQRRCANPPPPAPKPPRREGVRSRAGVGAIHPSFGGSFA